VAAPIKKTFVPRMPSEIFFHRLQTSVAFSALGFLVPFAAILTSRGKSGRFFLQRLAIFTGLSILIAISTSWFLKAQFIYLSGVISDLETKNPDIPVVGDHSMISLYRISLYPFYLMLVVIVFSLIRTFRDARKIREEEG